jgi:hypothetical protein
MSVTNRNAPLLLGSGALFCSKLKRVYAITLELGIHEVRADACISFAYDRLGAAILARILRFKQFGPLRFSGAFHKEPYRYAAISVGNGFASQRQPFLMRDKIFAILPIAICAGKNRLLRHRVIRAVYFFLNDCSSVYAHARVVECLPVSCIAAHEKQAVGAVAVLTFREVVLLDIEVRALRYVLPRISRHETEEILRVQPLIRIDRVAVSVERPPPIACRCIALHGFAYSFVYDESTAGVYPPIGAPALA